MILHWKHGLKEIERESTFPVLCFILQNPLSGIIQGQIPFSSLNCDCLDHWVMMFEMKIVFHKVFIWILINVMTTILDKWAAGCLWLGKVLSIPPPKSSKLLDALIHRCIASVEGWTQETKGIQFLRRNCTITKHSKGLPAWMASTRLSSHGPVYSLKNIQTRRIYRPVLPKFMAAHNWVLSGNSFCSTKVQLGTVQEGPLSATFCTLSPLVIQL